MVGRARLLSVSASHAASWLSMTPSLIMGLQLASCLYKVVVRVGHLWWFSVTMAVESYGNWGIEAQKTFFCLATLLAASLSVSKSKAAADFYGHLNMTLTRSVARAILSWPGV